MADVKMVSLTIEGRPVTVPEGMSILEAAKTAGVLIPHYCYHPGLPVAGVCRMCLVEVEKFPKLAPACATSVGEGQVVHVHSPKALEARKGVLEFLLINHPLDCPICDQAGECELQDYTFAEGRADSRYREPKRFNPVEDFGGDVLYVQNRCILCTRCVRFMSDVAQDPVLNVSERGDRAFIGKAEGHDLTNPWAGNVVDLCPVGALLSKDFLNRARAWELDRAPTVCTGCSQGCNAVAETRDNVVVRLKPRANDQVNQYYMCEVGRQGYREFNRRDRADQPLVRRGNALAIAEWDDAIGSAARALAGRRVVVLASANLSNEALFLLERTLAAIHGAGVFRLERGTEAPLPGAPDLALRRERAANATAARLLGFAETDSIGSTLGDGDALLVVGDQLEGINSADLDRASSIVYVGTALPASLVARAAVVLPITNILEEEGTLTNLRGRVQRFLQAKAAPGVARPTWYVLADLLVAVGGDGRFFMPAEVFAALAATHASFAGLDYEALGLRGVAVVDSSAPADTVEVTA
ncbi:2Fe-2S iron-sulfur cluster-binding protein [Gemmatimonas sp.]|uniref:2Fe-2S iron-sulfur cluster-binding protein n=1 Tax=Gemmatimonas sp. TaxID=1962908 RepID=UPI00286C9C61|nr:2Fe-2S iron-sulfur cluster-binding protein [Gemmatimonas sp.]